MAKTLQGCSGFEMRRTQGDEWGVYRVSDEKNLNLMLSFTDVEEAVEAGQTFAKMFKLKCRINRSML